MEEGEVGIGRPSLLPFPENYGREHETTSGVFTNGWRDMMDLTGTTSCCSLIVPFYVNMGIALGTIKCRSISI